VHLAGLVQASPGGAPSIDNRKPDNKGAAGGSTSGAGAQG
jgi:hypothetical protein